MTVINPFARDPNNVPDILTTRGRDVTYEGTLTSGNSPLLFLIANDLGRSARDGYITNDGTGSFTVEVSDDGVNYGGIHTLYDGETLDFGGLYVFTMRLVWLSDSSYRVFAI